MLSPLISLYLCVVDPITPFVLFFLASVPILDVPPPSPPISTFCGLLSILPGGLFSLASVGIMVPGVLVGLSVGSFGVILFGAADRL